jgi:hypothetical protein
VAEVSLERSFAVEEGVSSSRVLVFSVEKASPVSNRPRLFGAALPLRVVSVPVYEGRSDRLFRVWGAPLGRGIEGKGEE